MKLFFILCFLFTVSQLKAQYTVAKEPLPCLLLETFLKDLISYEGEYLNYIFYYNNNKDITHIMYADTAYIVDTLTIVFVDKSARLSHCKIDKINHYYDYKYKDDNINISLNGNFSINLKNKKQDTYRSDQYKESVLFNSAHIVITSIEEENNIISISFMQMVSSKNGSFKYKKENCEFILVEKICCGQY